MRILFMGTPEIAATALRGLVTAGFTVVGAVTGEDKPRGRGNKMCPTAVKAYAEECGIPVFTPRTLRDGAALDILNATRPDIIVVVAYGKILPKDVLEYPPLGCINMHVSLLPRWRGAAPMQRAVMAGDEKTGVTVMHMAEGLDTGDMISTVEFPIGPRDDFESVHDRAAALGTELLVKTLPEIEAGRATRTPQDDSLATYAAKVEKSEGRIDLSLDARELDRKIRGVTPFPGAYVYLGGKMLKIYNAEPIEAEGTVGEVIDLDGRGEGYITVACGEGALRIRGVIPEGRGRMSAGDFIRGRRIALGDLLS
ncbi:MAG: methionyl-tRNA formyltransferase [Clostridia bacterium]|nr:methionyl-tRNA formyltransferase [Clostridia bacterium]